MEFCVLSRDTWVPDSGKDTVYLKIDHWNDYSFVTMFHMSLHDEHGHSMILVRLRLALEDKR